jgi:putative flavoprotein involved in K+ transport
MTKHIETVIIGAGQAGLATSYYLSKQGHEHIVLEQASQVADKWRNQRWDSFTLVTPNWALQLPGAVYNGDQPEGFLPRNEMVGYLEQYAKQFSLPVQYNVKVTSVERSKDGSYHISTPAQDYIAENVVVATGFFQQPKIPASSDAIAKNIQQLHSSQYKNPESLVWGSVLVVGSGQSGCQIAEELNEKGRKVFLCIGNAGRVPRRYRGKDIIQWLQELGFFDLTPEQLPPGMGKFDGIPHLTGVNGGHTMNLHQLAKDGVNLLGHLTSAKGNVINLAGDMHETLARVDGFEKNVIGAIEEFIQANKTDAPREELPRLRYGFEQPVITQLDLAIEKINTIIWATGYTFDYTMLKLPVLDSDGFPIQQSGVSNYEGLYFVGLPWMPSEKSGFLVGMVEAAKRIASHITERAHT